MTNTSASMLLFTSIIGVSSVEIAFSSTNNVGTLMLLSPLDNVSSCGCCWGGSTSIFANGKVGMRLALGATANCCRFDDGLAWTECDNPIGSVVQPIPLLCDDNDGSIALLNWSSCSNLTSVGD